MCSCGAGSTILLRRKRLGGTALQVWSSHAQTSQEERQVTFVSAGDLSPSTVRGRNCERFHNVLRKVCETISNEPLGNKASVSTTEK